MVAHFQDRTLNLDNDLYLKYYTYILADTEKDVEIGIGHAISVYLIEEYSGFPDILIAAKKIAK